MGVGLVKKEHRALPRIQEREQHQHLLKSAARAGDVEWLAPLGHCVLGPYVRSAGVRGQQFIAKELSDRVLECGPGSIIQVRGDEQVAQHFSGTTKTEDLLYSRGLKEPARPSPGRSSEGT